MGEENQWEYGVCKPHQDYQEYALLLPQSEDKHINGNENNKTCYPMFYKGCRSDSNCCTSLLCEKKPGVKVGTCKPYTALKILNANDEWIECFENWYEYCIGNEDCCSGICHQFDSLTSLKRTSFGVCLPDVRIVSEKVVREIRTNHPNVEVTRDRTTKTQNHRRNKRSTSVGGKKVICYLGSWANYKPGDGKFVGRLGKLTMNTYFLIKISLPFFFLGYRRY